MSFIMPSQRGSDFQHSPDLSTTQSSRIHMPPASFDSYPANLPPSQLQNGGAQPSFVPDHTATNLPKVGETRCYWTLLSADLHFIYLDPVLASHLGEQADDLVGKSVLDFVHPDEQASAKHDLGSVLESRTLHGSITRVRYSRLSRVRRQLGYQGPPPGWSDADKIAVDSNYMAVDIVINWAAEGLVLCFIHAVVDLTPNDNDEHNKTGWTNWCGTPSMGSDQIQLIYRRLLVCIPQTGSTRVFQILSNQPGRPLLMNWPPDQGQGPTGRDFAKLVEDVQIGTGLPSGTDAKTSCTRRYRATQDMSAVMSEVESIFIPHGTVIFACHKVNLASRSASTGTAMQQIGYPNSYVPQQNQQHYYEQSSPYVLPPLPSSSSSSSSYHYLPQSQPIPAQYSPPHWSQGSEPSHPQPQYTTWNSPSPAHSIASLPSTASNIRSASYPPPSQSQQWSTQSSSSYMEEDSPMTQGSPSYGYSESEPAPAPATNDVVPPPRRRVSPGTTRDQYGPGGRSAGNRPIGVLKCSSCKATQSPEWRKGPSGKKELCNACGLRYARSRAKKEGHNLTQRRRKDKGLAVPKRESATPPVATPTSYSSNRRNDYDEPPFMSPSSAGSGSGSEVYSHSGHPTLDNLTPSPSPPATNMSFVHYSPHSHHTQNSQVDSRQHYSSTSSFYSVPSPLSNPPVIHQHGNQPSVPRLEQVSTYSDRLSPTSPVQSPLTTTMPPASFERERDRDRELPPTPISAEPRRVGRRSILTQQ